MNPCVFRLSKRGNRPEECEDAFASDATVGRFAVADGATESAFAREWAQLLVDQFVASHNDDSEDGMPWFVRAREQLSEGFRGRELKWYAHEKLRRQGASATFLGIVVSGSPGETRKWRGVAIGDTCLFHVRSNELLWAFPIDRSDDFGNAPELVCTKASPEEIGRKRTKRIERDGQPDDRLWMMTDALAQWCLVEEEAGTGPWKAMERWLDPEATNGSFAEWVESLRDEKRIRNDDVTLLAVDL